VIYHGAHDDFGTGHVDDATNDNGNTAAAGRSPTPTRSRSTSTRISPARKADAFTACPATSASMRSTASTPSPSASSSSEAKVSFCRQHRRHPTARRATTVLTGFEVFNFTDGTRATTTPIRWSTTCSIIRVSRRVEPRMVDADTHYHTYGRARGPRSGCVLLHRDLSLGQSGRKSAGVDPLLHFDQFG